MPSPLTLKSGAKTTSRKVTDLQRKAKEVVDEAVGGVDVLLSKNGEPIAALVEIERYIQTQNRAAAADELSEENARLRAQISLLAAGGPTLAQVREEAAKQTRLSSTQMLERARARQAAADS